MENTTKKTTTKRVVKPKITLGVVTNCSKLNVRSAPSKQAKVLCIISAGDTLQIDPVNDNWVKVCTAAGIEGYCRKEFIEVK